MNAPLFIVNLNWPINIYAWLGILGFLLFYFFRGTKVSCATVFISQLMMIACLAWSCQLSHHIVYTCHAGTQSRMMLQWISCAACNAWSHSVSHHAKDYFVAYTPAMQGQSRMMRQYIIYFRTCRVTFSLHHTLYTSLSSMRAMQGRSLA